ncbi:MAG TPA: SH3 domain-containing protein [Bacillota bacterium]
MTPVNHHLISKKELLRPEFWIARLRQPDRIIMTAPQIHAYNQAVVQNLHDMVVELSDYPETIDQTTLTAWITKKNFPQTTVYCHGQPVTPTYYNALETKLNLNALQTANPVRYGFTVKRANLRTFPTDDLILEDSARPEFDLFQETALNPAEALLILHQSATGDWYFVQTANYRGWLAAGDLGITDRVTWQNYRAQPDFLIVTGSHLKVTVPTGAGELTEVFFEMGAKIPLAEATPKNGRDYLVRLPVLESKDRLVFKTVTVPVTATVTLGYLPYTRANILQQAFKMYGQPYDWGGRNGSIDCSAFIMNIFHCFGFKLPRNSNVQAELPGKTINLASLSSGEKMKQLRSLQPGATLYLKGHVMLFLGLNNGCPLIIHALSSYGVPDSLGKIQKVYHLQVAVTDLFLLRASGQSFFEALTTAKTIELEL